MERSHKLDPNKHRSVDPKVSASQPGLVGLRPNFGLLPRFHLSANGGKKYNNDEANHAASSVDQRLSEIVPDGLVKFGPQITVFYALSRYVSLRHSPFFWQVQHCFRVFVMFCATRDWELQRAAREMPCGHL